MPRLSACQDTSWRTAALAITTRSSGCPTPSGIVSSSLNSASRCSKRASPRSTLPPQRKRSRTRNPHGPVDHRTRAIRLRAWLHAGPDQPREANMRLTDTLSGQKREFVPLGDEVLMYVCGVTPYAESHIGHAMSYIVFDVLRRYLEYRGYRVRHVQNFTDIDDKLIERARLEGRSPEEVARAYTESY